MNKIEVLKVVEQLSPEQLSKLASSYGITQSDVNRANELSKIASSGAFQDAKQFFDVGREIAKLAHQANRSV